MSASNTSTVGRAARCRAAEKIEVEIRGGSTHVRKVLWIRRPRALPLHRALLLLAVHEQCVRTAAGAGTPSSCSGPVPRPPTAGGTIHLPVDILVCLINAILELPAPQRHLAPRLRHPLLLPGRPGRPHHVTSRLRKTCASVSVSRKLSLSNFACVHSVHDRDTHTYTGGSFTCRWMLSQREENTHRRTGVFRFEESLELRVMYMLVCVCVCLCVCVEVCRSVCMHGIGFNSGPIRFDGRSFRPSPINSSHASGRVQERQTVTERQ